MGSGRLPRKSFAAWRETVSGKSRPWTETEVEAANLLRTTVLDVVLHQADALLRETERARIKQDLLMAELEHRSKNTIATIQSLVRLSSWSADTLTDFTIALERRLQSMAKAHSLLLAARWEGASITSIVRDEFAAHRSLSTGNVRYQGLGYSLEPEAGLSFALILHELVTNAVKHGSLSIPSGKVELTWQEVMERGQHWLQFNWIERDGPTVAPVERIGFGRTLLERVFAANGNGKVRLAFPPSGATCEIAISFSKVVSSDGARAAPSWPETPIVSGSLDKALTGVRVLVVEDDALILMDVIQTLEAAGASISGAFLRFGEALGGAAELEFDVALVTVNLDARAAWRIARMVRDRELPVVLSSDDANSFGRPVDLMTLPVVLKPYQTDILVAQLQTAAKRPARG